MRMPSWPYKIRVPCGVHEATNTKIIQHSTTPTTLKTIGKSVNSSPVMYGVPHELEYPKPLPPDSNIANDVKWFVVPQTKPFLFVKHGSCHPINQSLSQSAKVTQARLCD
jgi:hypothetical protein